MRPCAPPASVVACSCRTAADTPPLRAARPPGLSALGNCIACNDYVALVHTDIDKETEELIADCLGVSTRDGFSAPFRVRSCSRLTCVFRSDSYPERLRRRWRCFARQ